jgi:S1-C subfamily serine protease
MELAPGLFVISHNLGRLMKVNNDDRIRMSKRDAERCADLYSAAITSKKFPASKPQFGWMLMDFIELEGDDLAKTDTPADVPKNIVSGGTGFVVKGNYILTNKHVVGDSKTVKVRPADGQTTDVRDGSVIAVAPDVDLAIVRCEGLNLAPVEIASTVPRRASDIMILGFPQFDQLGATLKSTRGAVTSLPSPATENMMLVDAEMNSGNSGGPMANKYGQVVAVATAVFKPIGGTGGRYGAGIPIASHTAFLAKHIPGGVEQRAPGAELDWPDVDGKVSHSTVLILIEGEADEDARGSTLADGYGIPLLDPTCPGCNGTKTLRRGVKCHFCRGTGFDLEVVKAVIDELEEAKQRRGE